MTTRAPKTGGLLDYHRDVRPNLRTGDVLLYRGGVTLSRVIEAVEGGEYSHSAFVLRWNARAMVVQAEFPRLEAVPTSIGVQKYSGRVDWYRVTEEHQHALDVDRLAHEATRLLGRPFAVADLIRVGIYNVLHKPIPKQRDENAAFFCSEYVSHCFRHAGLVLAPDRKHDLAVSPDAIRDGGRLRKLGTIHWDPDARPESMTKGFVTPEAPRANGHASEAPRA